MIFAFTSGMITMGYAVAGLLLLRFWQRTRDMLFGMFAVSFWCFAVNQALLGLSGLPQEERSGFYLLRVMGYVLIIAAIVMKNLAKSVQRSPTGQAAPRAPFDPH